MRELFVYLTFPGNCEEAMDFYRDCFDGEITGKQTFGESPVPSPDEYKSKIMHTELKFGDIKIMASDCMPDQPPVTGSNISLTIDVKSPEDQDVLFQRLSEGGKVVMDLQDTFWGARFGMCTDKYGFHWLLNYTKPQ